MRTLLVCTVLTVTFPVVADEERPLRAPRPEAPIEYATTDSDSIDRLIAQELETSVDSFVPADDVTFLRRATLDLIGRQPTIEEQRIFENDSSDDKRTRLIERLLADERFGKNWANYWSDTISYHVAPPELTFLTYEPFKEWMTQQLNENRPWDQIVTEILTSSGKVAEVPAVTFVAYHQAEPTKLAAETARIFLGMQIQCAECHDHPFEDWTREQFHSLAAYFARSSVKMPHNKGAETVVSSKEKGEYTMPNADPSKKGKEMKPAFVDGKQYEGGLSDEERRAELARLLTDRRNRWFARAFTNKIWDRVAADGFYSPVDNIGDNQPQMLPSVHAALTDHFLATGYDIKDLYRVVLNTRYYQQQTPLDPGKLEHPFASLEMTRLRGDEVFDSLETALKVPIVKQPTPKPTSAIRFPVPPKSIQEIVAETYGYDPSFGPKTVQRNMSQAMLMMNNEELQQQVNADPESGTELSRILKEESDNDRVIERLYELMLARKPTETEQKTCREHLASVKDRGEGFEDLLWALMNSTEFTTRR
ncbi:MAG TPA: DUF1549 domain-containing protein [Planctomycetaceae bacterium]|nr:DUF1549 domain-containing protein [Planctomycetaceae bacterium]